MQIETDEKFNEWLDTINATESTRNSYLTHMKNFCGCVDKTPTELIEESIREIKEGKLPAERKSKGYVAKFKKCLSDKGSAPKSQQASMAALKSFYKSYDMPLSHSITRSRKAQVLEENNVFLKREDVIKLIVNTKNLREKAIIFCMVTSGMAIKEIINIKVGNIEIDNDGIGTIKIRREKAKTDYITFISPEATVALKNYWDERNRDPETKIKGKDDFAFVSYGNRSKGKQLDPITVSRLFNIMGEQLGYDNGDGFIKSRSHALRKYFASTLEDNGFPKPKIDFMMGHTVSDIDKAYFNRDPDKLKELYITFLRYLIFEKDIKVHSLNTEDAEKLQQLETDNMVLQSRITELEANQGVQDREAFKNTVELLQAQINDKDKDLEGMKAEMKQMQKEQIAFFEAMRSKMKQ